ncbi:MAG: DUF3006 domain-containing protein [Collinsella sp.]|nr:DUF3006 domain-containing protein [Collinsella sp.]
MIVDRIEGGLAVIEVGDGSFVEMPLLDIEGEVRDGAVLERDGDGLRVDEDATAARAERIATKRRRLFRG